MGRGVSLSLGCLGRIVRPMRRLWLVGLRQLVHPRPLVGMSGRALRSAFRCLLRWEQGR